MQSSDSPKNADTSLNWRRSDPVIKNDDDVQNTTFANMVEFENYRLVLGMFIMWRDSWILAY